MGRAEREKGARYELEVAKEFRAAGFDVDRVPNSGGLKVKGDIKANDTSLDGFHLECKRQETLALPKWLRQAHEEAPDGSTPVVIFRQSSRGSKLGVSHACLPLADLIELLRIASGRGVVGHDDRGLLE